ncbi:MAG TPA: hypothetical protein VFI13_09860, partial [Gemmatimonadales bacterium]|nr:hypothetical protein [Gemmatimonadales bacterium]
MRRTLIALALLAAPAGLAAQASSVTLESLAIKSLSDYRRLTLLPNETIGFRILGTADAPRTMRVTTGHLIDGHLYRAVATIIPRDGSPTLRAEGTVSTESPTLALGLLPAGGYVITMHLEDLAT